MNPDTIPNAAAQGKKINHIAEEEADIANEDDWTPDRKHSIQQKIHSLATKNKNGPPIYTATLLVNNRPIRFIINTGSPVPLIKKSKFNKVTTLKPITVDYRDVKDNKIEFEVKTTANIDLDGTEYQLELLITTKNTLSLLDLDDITVVTKGSKQKPMEKLKDVLTRPENAGYRLSEKKSELFKNKIFKKVRI